MAVGDSSNGNNGSGPVTSLRAISSSNSITSHTNQPQGYVPISAKGHKESVYALAMNESGTLLVSGGTEKVYFINFVRIYFVKKCIFLLIFVM